MDIGTGKVDGIGRGGMVTDIRVINTGVINMDIIIGAQFQK